jgi:hypothetical protein
VWWHRPRLCTPMCATPSLLADTPPSPTAAACRLSTIKNADMIAVVQKGVIVEQGTHAQLLRDPLGERPMLCCLCKVVKARLSPCPFLYCPCRLRCAPCAHGHGCSILVYAWLPCRRVQHAGQAAGAGHGG